MFFSLAKCSPKVWCLDEIAAMLSSPRGSEMREGKLGTMGHFCSNPIPAGPAAAACTTFHNSAGFVNGERGRIVFLHDLGHQRCHATAKATESLGVDDCNPPFSPLLITSAR